MIFHIEDLSSLKLDQTLVLSTQYSGDTQSIRYFSHKRPALISFRTFGSPSSANLPFGVSPTFKTLRTGTSSSL